LAACFGLAAGPGLAARGLAGQSQSPGSQQNADVVQVFFTVRDGNGALVPGLSKDDFLIFEGGHPQSIKSLDNASAAPLNLSLVLETTGRMQANLQADKAASIDFLRQVATADDFASVISFNSESTLELGLTHNIERLRKSLERVEINRDGESKGLLYDSVYVTANELLEQQAGRKVMVIFTSGVDDGSKEKLEDAIQAVQKADTICYVINHLGPWSSGRISLNMKALSDSTGGSSFLTARADATSNWLNIISNELRSQYVVTYKSDSPKHDGSLRKIEIRMKDRNSNYSIHARDGYFAPTN
jgi:VWFA-related protein